MRRVWGWALGGAAAASLVAATVWWWDREGLVPAVQAIYPVLSAAALVLVVAAALTRARRSFAAALLAFLVTLTAMAPTVLPTGSAQARPDPGRAPAAPAATGASGGAGEARRSGRGGSSPTTLSVLALNTQFGNADLTVLAREVQERDVDVLILTEAAPDFTPYVTDAQWKETFPYDSGPTRWDAQGTLVLSRYPMTVVDADLGPEGPHSAAPQQPIVTLDVHGTTVTVRGVHPRSPSSDEKLPQWRSDLAALTAWQRGTSGPLVMAGDFNSAWPHPAFRELADGLQDAMRVTGQPWAPTWPEDGRVPPFTQIDHVLSRGFTTQAADRVRVPGTDHLGVWARLTLG